MKKKLLFITTHNLATNPRLVKEIRLALDLNCQVDVISFEFDNWSKEINNKLIQEFPTVNFIIIPAGRKPFIPWVKSVSMEFIFRYLSRMLPLFSNALATAVSRRNILLNAAFKKFKKPDWIIGHNPGAMFATIQASRYFNSKSGFDVEDYHPGEGDNLHLQRLTLSLMKKMLPKFDYVSFASESIMQQCLTVIDKKLTKRTFVIDNAFSQKDFVLDPPEISGKLKLVWFSQNISFNRGLEQIIPIINDNFSRMELHLYGNMEVAFEKEYLNAVKGVIYHGAVSQEILHKELSLYDIGLAIEPGKDLNNELAVSNKISAYLQSGLFVIATNTQGQCALLQAYTGTGSLIQKDFQDAAQVMASLVSQKQDIRNNKRNRIEKMKYYSWENQSKPLSKIWNL